MVRSLRRGRAPHEEQVHRITDARRSAADDQHARFVKYAVSMSVRMVFIVLALIVDGPLLWLCIAGAVVLPYVAVIVANASREQAQPAPQAWGMVRPALGPGGDRPPSGTAQGDRDNGS